jgi:hypothetical protein
LSVPSRLGARRPAATWFLAYSSLIILAEAIFGLVDVAVGTLLLAAALLLIATHVALTRPPRDPVLPALALVPLVSLLTVAMPVPGLAAASAYVLAGLPALLGAGLVARALGLSATDLGLGVPRAPAASALTVAVGGALGLLGTVVGMDPIDAGGLHPVAFFGLVVVPFVVMLEEIVFRGILQRTVSARSPMMGVLVPSAIYAAVYFGSGSTAAVLFMGLVGLVFGFIVHRTGTLWGVLGAHLVLRILLQI